MNIIEGYGEYMEKTWHDMALENHGQIMSFQGALDKTCGHTMGF